MKRIAIATSVALLGVGLAGKDVAPGLQAEKPHGVTKAEAAPVSGAPQQRGSMV